MAFVNTRRKEIQAKIVFYGPGRGGKTSNLEYIYKKFSSRVKADMVSINTHGDRTLYFDFLPFDVGKVLGYDVTVQLYTVPGQVKYDATRRLVLRGADGLVFVADSMTIRREKNFESLKNLQKNLSVYKKSIFKIPLVLQYNKRDIKDIPLQSLKTMEKELNGKLKVPSFAASAVTGHNVVATLKKIISRTMLSLRDELEL